MTDHKSEHVLVKDLKKPRQRFSDSLALVSVSTFRHQHFNVFMIRTDLFMMQRFALDAFHLIH